MPLRVILITTQITPENIGHPANQTAISKVFSASKSMLSQMIAVDGLRTNL